MNVLDPERRHQRALAMPARATASLPVLGTLLLAVIASSLLPGSARARGQGDEPRTIVLADPDHPLTGSWQWANAAGTAICPATTVPLPADGPVPVTITASDGGARLHVSAGTGSIDLQTVEVTRWDTATSGEAQVLRQTIRTDNAALIAWALEGEATVYEGTVKPAPGMVVHYIMGWAHDDPDVLRGHTVSTFQPGCTAKRAFLATRGG